MLAHGTTTLETKTGYALHKPGEAELLDIIAAHRDDADVPRLIATFLGAHALPPEFTREGESAFVDYLIDQVIPARRRARRGVCRRVLRTGILFAGADATLPGCGAACGMRLRVHCDEMAFGGAAEMAVRVGVDAVDHCNYIRDEDVRAIAERGHRDRRVSRDDCVSRTAESRAGSRAARSAAAPSRSRATTIPGRRRASICRRWHTSGASSSGFRRPKRSTA